MPFDPNKPFEVIGGGGGFDPSKPYEAAPDELKKPWHTSTEDWETYDPRQRQNAVKIGTPEPPQPDVRVPNDQTAPMGAATIGGLAGATLGAAGGPAGMVAGGALGGAAGRYAGEVINNLTGRANKSMPEMGKSALHEGYWQALLGAGFPIAARLKEGLIAGAVGIGPEQMKIGRDMAAAGMAPGIADVAKGVFPQTFENVIGRFPFAGAPFRQAFGGHDEKLFRFADEGKVARANRQTQNQVESAGTPRNATDVGEEMFDRGTATYKKFRDDATKLYDDARSAATAADLPTNNLRKAADDITREWDAGAVEGMTRAEPEVVQRARELAGAPERLTFKQYEAVSNEMDRLFRVAKTDGHSFKKSYEFDAAAKQDLDGLSDPAALQKFKDAEKFFADGRKTFETPVAKKFGTVEKKVFGFGFEEAGTRNPDELMALAFSKRSPQAMAQLHDLVGKQTFSDALATSLDDVFSKSMKDVIVNGQPAKVLDADLVRKSLGMDRERGPAFQSLATAYRLAGKPGGADQLVKFLEAVDATTARGAPNLSQFLSRRAALGGTGGVEGAFPMGRAIIQGSVGPLITFLGARRISHILASPERLRDMTIMLDPQSRAEAIEAAYRRIAKAIPVAAATSGGGAEEIPAGAQRGTQQLRDLVAQ